MGPNLKISQGSLLVSEPFLDDSYFRRSVVLLAKHNEEGSVGFILNKPTDIKIADVVDDFPEFDACVNFGGPVDKNYLFYIHTIGPKLQGATKIQDDIYWGGNFDILKDLIIEELVEPHQIRFFSGYAGWDPYQLKFELEEEETWMIPTFNREIVFPEEPAALWSKVLKSMGGKYSIMANYPEDPSLN